LSREPYATSSDSAYNIGRIEVEEDVDIIEEVFISMNKEVDIDIKQEVPEDITFCGIESEPDEVS
jgi:hypothetical protein